MRLSRVYNKFLVLVSLPIILEDFFASKTGFEYKIGLKTKINLLYKVIRNIYKIKTATSFLEHLFMITKILNIPKKYKGCIIECGSFYGGSTANLSLAAHLTNRRLEVFDSFEGLPEPQKKDAIHILLDSKQIHTYKKGFYHGSLNVVKSNVRKYGNIDSCNFHKGYFEETLPNFNKKTVFIFLDVDLVKSYRDCLKYLWKRLSNNCYLFIHEVKHIDVSFLFFDKKWWKTHLKIEPPGLIGAGSGLGLSPSKNMYASEIGYTIKNPNFYDFTNVPQTGI